MASYEITFNDRSIDRIDDADAYQPEGPMTTFFASDAGHGRLDAWSTRLASFRSADIASIRRVEQSAGAYRPNLEVVVGG